MKVMYSLAGEHDSAEVACPVENRSASTSKKSPADSFTLGVSARRALNLMRSGAGKPRLEVASFRELGEHGMIGRLPSPEYPLHG